MKFQFDKKTGTMVRADSPQPTSSDDITVNKSPISEKPTFEKSKDLAQKSSSPSVKRQPLRMHRVNKQTPVQLIDEHGKPEAYLDAIDQGVMMFREKEDYDICQIIDEKTRKPLAFIGGYGLEFSFNMSELRSMEKIETCLQGLMKLFRNKIMSQTFDNHSQ